jgi:hypothetical protein
MLEPGKHSPKSSSKITLDGIIYMAACVLSLGTIWLIRIIITRGVMMANEEQ